MGQRAADGTGEGETGVELDAGELRRLSGLDVLLDGIDLGAASRGGGSLGGHCDGNVRSGDVVVVCKAVVVVEMEVDGRGR